MDTLLNAMNTLWNAIDTREYPKICNGQWKGTNFLPQERFQQQTCNQCRASTRCSAIGRNSRAAALPSRRTRKCAAHGRKHLCTNSSLTDRLGISRCGRRIARSCPQNARPVADPPRACPGKPRAPTHIQERDGKVLNHNHYHWPQEE